VVAGSTGTSLPQLHYSARYRVADITPFQLRYRVADKIPFNTRVACTTPLRHQIHADTGPYTSKTPDTEYLVADTPQYLSNTSYNVADTAPLRHQAQSCIHYTSPTPGTELHTLHLSDTRYRVAYTTPLRHQIQSCIHNTSLTPGTELHTLHLSDTRYRVACTTPL
jgi:hypothetical protein